MEPTKKRHRRIFEAIRSLEALVEEEKGIELKHPGALDELYGHLICSLFDLEVWDGLHPQEQMLLLNDLGELYEDVKGILMFEYECGTFEWSDGRWTEVDEDSELAQAVQQRR